MSLSHLTCSRIRAAALIVGALALSPWLTWASSPSFDCKKVRAGTVPDQVCRDDELARLDRKLAEVYAAARRKAANERPPILAAEQRGWVKGRDECWKSEDRRGCVAESYRRRTAELQARYRLVVGVGPVRYACNGNAADEIVVTLFATDPPVMIAERGDQVSTMYRTNALAAAGYVGRNETFREDGTGAVVRWGYGTAEMRCTRAAR
jgi:uncharacterized protein